LYADDYKDELGAFFADHLSDGAVTAFGSQFYPQTTPRPTFPPHQHHGAAVAGAPVDQLDDDADDDGLGYYPDGAKRTLTDEQIAMFRHSELHALERAAMRTTPPAAGHNSTPIKAEPGGSPGAMEGETGELPKTATAGDGKKRKRMGKASRPVKKEPKEDLRKRTWDVVEKGLDTLDYG
jgi:hypothetical protein